MKIIKNDSLLKELSARKIHFCSGSGRPMFSNVLEKYSYDSLLGIVRGFKPMDAKVCLFLTDRKLGLSCFFDEFDAALFSYSTLARLSRKKDITTDNMILFIYKDNGDWNSDLYWIVGKSGIPFTISGDLENNEALDSSKARNIIKRASKLKDCSDIIKFLEASLEH